jgi:hypothetical protein
MPRIGSIKRRELVASLRRLRYTLGLTPGDATSSCCGERYPSPFQIRTKVISGLIF